MDPLLTPLIISAGNTIGQVLAQVVGPFARNLIPSDSEQASIQLRHQELEMRERHFLEQIANSREDLLLKLESQHILLEYQKLLDRWPLALSPISILRESKRRSSYALNVIVTVVDTNDGDYYRGQGRGVNQTIDAISNGSLSIAEQATASFDNDMVCYRETLKSSRLTGDGLRTTLSVLLASEPTILIEVRVPDPNQVEFHICHWGLPFDTNPSYTRYKTQKVSLPPLPTSPETDTAESKRAFDQRCHLLSQGRNITIGLALSGLIVSIGDAFRTLQRPHILPAPVFPSLMNDPTFGLLPAGSPVPEAMWQPVLSTYLSTYDGVAGLNKLLASELAAKAALTAHQADQPGFANQLLDKAIQLNSKLAKLASAEEARIMAVLRWQRTNGQPSELEKALGAIRGWTVGELPPSISFEEMLQRFGPEPDTEPEQAEASNDSEHTE